MTNYNHSHYIDESLDRLLAQTYLPQGIIIIDDASGDDSKERINSWIDKHADIIKFH